MTNARDQAWIRDCTALAEESQTAPDEWEWINGYLVMLAQAKDALLDKWAIEVRSDWVNGAMTAGHGHAYRCLICDAMITDLRSHGLSHRDYAEKLRDEDLVPLTVSMCSVLRVAQLGFEDTVKVGNARCIPRAFAIVIALPLRHHEMRWAFNRIWHDDDGFSDAIKAAAEVPRGAVKFIQQQYHDDD
jgi:hypothetical protein